MIPSGLTKFLAGFFDLLSKRVWPLVQVLLTDAIVTVGPHTIAAVLRIMDLSQETHFQKYYRVLNRVNWLKLAVSRRLLVDTEQHDRATPCCEDCGQGY